MSVSALTIFCDDIRTEQSGSDILVGIFPDILQSETGFPFVMPKLGVYTRIKIDFDAKPEAIDVILSVDSHEQQLTRLEADFIAKSVADAKAAGSPFAGFTSRTVFMGFVVPNPSRIMTIVRAGSQRIEAGFLTFSPDSPTASPPPSWRSPHDAPAS